MRPKRVFIIHRWEGTPESDWYPWLKKELESKGFDVEVPPMPDTQHPKLETWIPTLLQLIDKADENTYFVGHSIGCQTILRYLEMSPQKIGGVILVAPWVKLTPEATPTKDHEEIAKPWLEAEIKLEGMRANTENFIVLFSSNDPFVKIEDNLSVFKERLGAKIIIEKDKGHLTDEDSVTELPIVLEEIMKISKI